MCWNQRGTLQCHGKPELFNTAPSSKKEQGEGRVYHDKPKTTGLHVNEWLKSNSDFHRCCPLSCPNRSTLGGHSTSQDRLELSGNPSLRRCNPEGGGGGVLSQNKLQTSERS
ncbi:uncharacterized protein V6R79_006045 [Siganus canaliculatus]